MKKGNLVALIMGTIGGLMTSIGMCMCLVEEWNAFVPGVIVGGIGALVLLLLWPAYRKAENKGPLEVSKSAKQMIAMGILGSVVLGVGLVMCLTPGLNMMTPGIVIGVIGILLLLALIPVYRKATNKGKIQVNKKTLIAVIIGILGTFALGIGMSMIMVESIGLMIPGMVVGVVGLMVCIVNYPVYASRK